MGFCRLKSIVIFPNGWRSSPLIYVPLFIEIQLLG
jgi:hypothetical protein